MRTEKGTTPLLLTILERGEISFFLFRAYVCVRSPRFVCVSKGKLILHVSANQNTRERLKATLFLHASLK
jgi:hypothetical protein